MEIEDQATGLRKLHQYSNHTKIITVTGGKGGVGKTNVTINTAVALAKLGLKVLVIDTDLGLANVDVMLGLRANKNLSHVIAGICDIEQTIVKGPQGIEVIAATSGTRAMVSLSASQEQLLMRAIGTIEARYDVVLIDTAAGISDMVMRFSRAAHEVFVVVCDEPSSITDAYALIKVMTREHRVHRFKIIPNMVKNAKEGMELFHKLNTVAQKFLNIELQLLSIIPFDDTLRVCIKKQKLVVESYPLASSAIAYRGLANKVQSMERPNNQGKDLGFFAEKMLVNTANLREVKSE
ncbi:MinD/ParA family protein [Paraferrimonas sp. SM1919]|uniref:MinD/ParA family ATP-binding protein n=1 Tax=Paraferrimonas sp. SM1919 TaxID=2662263 RepID=UPI0013D5FC48|nr:MinD/ParA family protein [Paraferrimonas sp. SM1919]